MDDPRTIAIKNSLKSALMGKQVSEAIAQDYIGKMAKNDPVLVHDDFRSHVMTASGHNPRRITHYFSVSPEQRMEYYREFRAPQNKAASREKVAAEQRAFAEAVAKRTAAEAEIAKAEAAKAEAEKAKLELIAERRRTINQLRTKVISDTELLAQLKAELGPSKEQKSGSRWSGYGLPWRTEENDQKTEMIEFQIYNLERAIKANTAKILAEEKDVKNIQAPTVDPKLVTALQSLNRETKRYSRHSTNFQFPITFPSSDKTKSQEPQTKFSVYQYLPIDRMAKKCRNMPGILLFHSMGSGKTRTALGIAANLTKIANSVTIVVPKGLQSAWIDEMQSLNINTKDGKSQNLKYYSGVDWNAVEQNEKSNLRNLPIYGTILRDGNIGFNGIPFKKYEAESTSEFRYTIITYDKLLEGQYKHLLEGQVVIFDEAHNLLPMYKNSGCDATQKTRLKQVIESCKRIIFLSGTPIQTEMTDLAILINLCQKRSSDPLIVETPKTFEEFYYDPRVAERYQTLYKSLTNKFAVGATWVGVAGLAATAAGILTLPVSLPAAFVVGAGITAGASLLSMGLSAASMDRRSLNTQRLADHVAPYISYFDVMYETPENKSKFPYQSKRYTPNLNSLTYQQAIDKGWKEYKTGDEQVIYYNELLNPGIKSPHDAIAIGAFTTKRPVALDTRYKDGILVEGDDDEGQNEIPVPFDQWQDTLWISQFLNLEEESMDIAKMLNTYDQNLADTFGETAKDPVRFKKISEQLIKKPTTVATFMEKMRVITNLSKYCFYYEPVMDETDDEDITFYHEQLDGGAVKGNWQGNKTFVTKLKDNIIEAQIPTDKENIKSLPEDYTSADIFTCPKFEEVLKLITACRNKNHFIPLVYSNFDKYGFQLFSAFLNNRGFKHLIIHSSDEFAETNQKILNLSQQPFPRIGTPRPSDTRLADIWDKELNAEIEHYKEYINAYPKLKTDQDKKNALLKLVEERNYIPMCVLLHPDIKEGLSFTVQPEMMVLEVPMGVGNRDQIYARIIRALSLTPQGGLDDSRYYEVLPTEITTDGVTTKKPGIIRPQYIYDGIFLQEEMIVYKSETTPALETSVDCKPISSMLGLGVRSKLAEKVGQLQSHSPEQRSLIDKGKLAVEGTILSKLGIRTEDIRIAQTAHTVTVPRVKKIIHQFFGAENNPRVDVPKALRAAIPTLPSKMRFNFGKITRQQCVVPTGTSMSIRGIDIQFGSYLDRNYWKGWWMYFKGQIKGNAKIGTKTYSEYLAAMPVPWMTISPDDWVANENTLQEDQFEKIKLSLYESERCGKCAPEAKTPDSETCIRWESPLNPGTCRDFELNDIKGGTPTPELKSYSNAIKQTKENVAIQKSEANNSRSVISVENYQKSVNALGNSSTPNPTSQLNSPLTLQSYNQTPILSIKRPNNAVSVGKEPGTPGSDPRAPGSVPGSPVANNKSASGFPPTIEPTIESVDGGGKFKRRLTFPHHKKIRSTRKGFVKKNKTRGRKHANRRNRTHKK